jgi:hypothetical protein
MSLENAKNIQVMDSGEVVSHIFSADPNIAMREMMQTIDTLRGIYVQETSALEQADTQAFLALQDDKLEAARKYQRGIEEMIDRSAEMSRVSPALKKRVDDMQKEFSALAQKNMDALARMSRCVDRLGNMLRNAAKEAATRERTVSYNETGRLHGRNNKAVSTGSVSETA